MWKHNRIALRLWCAVVWTVFCSLLAGSASAGEVHIKRIAVVSGATVRLADVANVYDVDQNIAKRWRQLPLLESPPVGKERTMTREQILPLIRSRDRDLANCRFYGASSVTIRRDESPRRVSPSRQESLNQQSLNQEVSIDGAGLANANTGPVMAVTAIRPIVPGQVIQRDDVDLRPLQKRTASGEFVDSYDEVVGKEATRYLAPDKPIPQQAIQAPRLVRRGDQVALLVLASGVRIKTTAVAQQEGARGDVIKVKSLDGKHTYLARVAEYKHVEMWASGASSR